MQPGAETSILFPICQKYGKDNPITPLNFLQAKAEILEVIRKAQTVQDTISKRKLYQQFSTCESPLKIQQYLWSAVLMRDNLGVLQTEAPIKKKLTLAK